MAAFQPFKFAILTDAHIGDPPACRGLEKLKEAIEDVKAQGDLDFVLFLGDFLWDGPMPELRALLDTLELPYRIVLGNGDAPRAEEFAQEFGDLYYTFEHNDCLFIGLCTTPTPGTRELGQKQENWLIDTLALQSGRHLHNFVFAHVPPRPLGNPTDPQMRMQPDLARKLFDFFAMRNVKACFFGHIHQNEEFENRNIRYISTPSTNWNFDTNFGYAMADWVKTDFGGYRIVEVTRTGIKDELRWLHRNHETYE